MEKKMEFIIRNFSDAVKDDIIISDFSCSLQRDVLTQGRIYFSYHGFYFHSNILGFVKYCSGLWKNVKEIKKDKVAYVLPVVIHINIGEEKFSFSFLQGRDKIYTLVKMLWINHTKAEAEDKDVIFRRSILLINNDMNISKGELEYLSDKSDSIDLCSISNVSSASAPDIKNSNQELRLHLSPSTLSNNEIEIIHASESKSISSGISENLLVECNCGGEDFKEIILTEVSANLETVRSLLFDESSPVLLNLVSALSLQNFKIEKVLSSTSTDLETKIVTYMYPLGFPFPSVSTQSTYVFIHNPPWNTSHTYVICDSSSQNVTYSDSFHVINKYCFTKQSNKCTTMRVFSKVEFLKKIPSPIKSLINSRSFTKTTEYMTTLVRLMQAHLDKNGYGQTIWHNDTYSIRSNTEAQTDCSHSTFVNSSINIVNHTSTLHHIFEYIISTLVNVTSIIGNFDLMIVKDILIIALIFITLICYFKLVTALFDTLKKQQEFITYTTESLKKIMEKGYCSK